MMTHARWAVLVALIGAVFSVVAGSASADGAYGTTAPLTGTRSVGVGLVTGESDWLDAVLSWSIVDNGDLTWTYTYTLTGFDHPVANHMTLDLSDNALAGDSFADPAVITGALRDGQSIPQSEIEPGDKDGIVGVRLRLAAGGDTTVYSFISNRGPVYGDVYIKGGPSYLTNAGYGDHANQSESAFIATPGGVFPEPATLATLAIGSLVVLRKRRKA